MSERDLHIAFGESAGGTLRLALRQAGIAGKVVAFRDDLGFGPINPPDPAARAAWVKRELGFPDVDKAWPAEVAAFWTAALSATDRRVLWFSRRTARDLPASSNASGASAGRLRRSWTSPTSRGSACRSSGLAR